MQILPTAFLASHDEVSSVSSVWGGVWSEGCPSEPAALRMFTPELAGLVAGGVMSSSWDRKKGAAKVRRLLLEIWFASGFIDAALIRAVQVISEHHSDTVAVMVSAGAHWLPVHSCKDGPLLLALQALLVIADVAGDQLASYSPALSGLLLSEGCGGRLWEGKELLLQALGALAAHCTATLVQQPGEQVAVMSLLG